MDTAGLKIKAAGKGNFYTLDPIPRDRLERVRALTGPDTKSS